MHENAIAHTNIWDDGYPSGGNYWSNYAGIDVNGDGIGDTPYVIDENNQDRYPLMDQLTPSEPATPTPSGVQVGVKAGDFIRYEYAITGAPSSPLGLPQWAKIEFLSIEEEGGTFRITMHYTDGREYNDTGDWSFKSGSINLGSSFMGIVIPSNSTKGDMVHMIGGINATIAGETTKMCAGISRTVVYSSFYQDYPASQFEYYWDKATGVMVEASLVSGDVTAIVTTIETNMWGTSSLPFYLQWWFYVAIAAVVALLVGAVYFLKKRKPPAPAVAPALPESTQ